jgi:hypothetical protein
VKGNKFTVWGVGSWIWDLVMGLGFSVKGFRYLVLGLGFRV